ncbi:iron ABC transporter permease [Lysinibacillus sp. 3P01SB]|uniref:iron ABC transporter permease n=1 Tax=Lysinibacillus sp. 3P01SB TaxID=3132284 RepID=UPI0039A4E8C2
MKKTSYFILSIMILLVLSVIHLIQGQADYTVSQLLTEIWAPGRIQDVVLTLRLPRLVIGIIGGMALAVAGAMLQTLTRNPLASASTLGINAGAFFFIVLSAVFFPSLLSEFRLGIALCGAVLSALMILLLAGRQMEPVRVALTGMIITLFFSSLTGTLQLLYENETGGLFLWGSGTLVQLDWSGVQFAWPVITIFLVIALLLAKQLDLFQLGEDLATSLGQNVPLMKLVSWIVAIVLASTVVSVVGPIGFIGLMAPHLVKLLGVKKHGLLFTFSMVWGAILLVGADVAGRFISPHSEIPVGALTALVGAPCLLYLAWKKAQFMSNGQSKLGNTAAPIKLPLSLLAVGVLFIALSFMAIAYNGDTWILDWSSFVITEFRMPRVLTAALVGVLLAISGLLLQGILRNPLADTSVIGLTSLGGAGGMIFLVVLPSVSLALLPIGIAMGTIFAFGVIYLMARKTKFNPVLVALIGIGLSAFGSSIIQVLTIKAKLTVTNALVFLSGSTYATNWSDFKLVLLVVILVAAPSILLSRYIDMLQFGEDTAQSMGVNLSKIRIITLLFVVILTTFTITVVGVIGFIGLVAPHIARRIVGNKTRAVWLLASMIGAFLLVLADFIGRTIIMPSEVPSGLVVSLIGAPYLLYLMYKMKY